MQTLDIYTHIWYKRAWKKLTKGFHLSSRLNSSFFHFKFITHGAQTPENGPMQIKLWIMMPSFYAFAGQASADLMTDKQTTYELHSCCIRRIGERLAEKNANSS